MKLMVLAGSTLKDLMVAKVFPFMREAFQDTKWSIVVQTDDAKPHVKAPVQVKTKAMCNKDGSLSKNEKQPTTSPHFNVLNQFFFHFWQNMQQMSKMAKKLVTSYMRKTSPLNTRIHILLALIAYTLPFYEHHPGV